ncbi:Glycosyl transferases group 1 [Planctomycetes bacterium Poly30]|uniref:Glycosyl transferases group 1 n=1 Tax=Saltatorellus ferox TaxID=2528018 RepID=A0A518EPN3_9BACT|nr:Glycosyl transferases group 1 [Planctomycetes bacterium Poly30]
MSPPPHERPRIAFLGARGVPARYGGFETFVEEIGARLVQRGIDVTVFCEQESEEGDALVRHRGMDLRYVRAWAPGPARTIQVDVSGLLQTMRGFDVVYLLGYGAAFAAWLPRLTGTAVWINPDGIEWQRSKWGAPAKAWLALMERIACRAATRLVIDNGALAENIGARAKLGPHSVLAYGAETLDERLPEDAVRALGLTPGEYDLLVCRFEPENHVDEILRAHAQANTGRPLVAVAHTDTGTAYAKRTMERARDAAGDGRVRFLGAIYDQDVLLPLRQHSALYLHGHSVGGTNPSLLEAMGAGNVVLAHDNPFNREVLGDQEVYWDGIDALTRRIGDWATRATAEIESVRERNRARIREEYSWDRLADDYAALIRAESGRR